MKRRVVVFLGLLLGLAPMRTARAAPQSPPQDLASLLPAGTMFLVEGDDLGGTKHWVQETALGRIWAEPEMQVFVQGVKATIAKALARFQGGFSPLAMVGLAPEDFLGIRIRSGGLAIVNARFDGAPSIDAVFTVRFRAGAAKGIKIATALRDAIGTYFPFSFEPTQLAGHAMQHLPIWGHDFHLFAEKDRILLTTTRERMEQMLDALAQGNGNALRASERYATVVHKMGAARPAVMVYADAPRLYALGMGIAAKHGKPERLARFERTWKLLGLDAMQAIAFGDLEQGTGFRTELAVTLRERRGLFDLIPTGRTTHRFARFAPASSLAYGDEAFDAKVYADKLLALIAAVVPEHQGAIQQGEARLNQICGIDLRKDLLGSLGAAWAYYLGPPPGGGLIPDLAVFAAVKDPAKLSGALDTLAANLEPLAARGGVEFSVRETTFRGHKIRFLELARKSGDPIPVAPAWTVSRDFVVFALAPQTIKNALVEKQSLAANPEFGALLRAIPQDAVSIGYLDTRALAGWIYNTLVPIAQVFQGAINRELGHYGLRVNFQDLPSAEVITRHLGGTMSYVSNQPDGLRIGFVSPFGSAFLVVPMFTAGAVVGLVSRREVARDREMRQQHRHAARAGEMERLRQRNAHLKARMDRIEKELEELRRLVEERRGR